MPVLGTKRSNKERRIGICSVVGKSVASVLEESRVEMESDGTR